MTIASPLSRISYIGDGSTTGFPVPFYFAANADLVVYLQDTLGNQTAQILGTNYNLTGATVSSGGTCTFIAAPTTGYLVTIYRDPAITQTASYNNNDPFPAKSHELALDKLTTIAQRAKDMVSRAIHQTEGEAAMTTALAPIATRKNKLLGFGASGELIYPLGPSFVSGTAIGVANVDSRATAAVTTFPVSVNAIITSGLATAGDGGGATYIKGISSGAGAFQDASGQYWVFGAIGGNSGTQQMDSRAAVALATTPTSVLYIRTAGYAAAGDGGGALLKRAAGASTSTAAVQSANGIWFTYVPEGGKYNVLAYGATGAGSSHADDTYINSALVDIRAAGGGTLWFPFPASSYWVTSAIDVRATSNLLIDGDPGTTIKASSAFNASDNNSKSSIISGLNFTGTAPSTGYAYSNITISRNLIIDGSNQNVSGLPAPAIGGFGYNMCSIEIMNVDNVSIYAKTVGAFGNGPVISTHDPRLTAPSITGWTINAFGTGYAIGDTFKLNGGTVFTGSEAVFRVLTVNGSGGATSIDVINRGIYITLPATNVSTTTVTGIGSGCQIQVTNATVFNTIRNPTIVCEIVDTCRGLLPSYSQVGDVGGIAGSCLQIGAATNILIDVRVTRAGGPSIDVFNCNGGFVHVECDSVSSTPVGSTQKRGVMHSDFGAQNITFTGRVPSVDMRGAMQSGTSYFFNGGTPSQGPTNCTFDIHVQGYNAPDGNTQGVILAGGSITGTVGNVFGCKGRFTIESAQGIAFALFDGRFNDFELQVYEPGTTAGQYKCVSLNAQVNQVGGGCAHNSFTLMSRDIRSLLENNFVEDGSLKNSANTIWGNEHLNATTGTSINLTGGTYTLK